LNFIGDVVVAGDVEERHLEFRDVAIELIPLFLDGVILGGVAFDEVADGHHEFGLEQVDLIDGFREDVGSVAAGAIRNDRELELLGWALQREAESGYPSGRIYLDGLTAAMASRLVSRHSSLARKFSPNGNAGLTGYRLKQVLAFIEEQLTENLSLERIAAVARVSSSHLNTLFRHSMGVAVHQYVIQRRVELAKTLLMKEEKSITEIALEAGFAHQSHLARHMRRMLGLPPRALKLVPRPSRGRPPAHTRL